MNKGFITSIKILKKAIDSKKLVVFAGAGLSIDSKIPSWNTLISSLKSGIDLPNDEKDYLKIAQMYFNERDSKEYIDKVREILKYKKTIYNELHEITFDLKPEHIITTNYDELFEQVIYKKALPFSIVSKDQHFPFSINSNLLVKIHGDLNGNEFVLKEDDYLDFSDNHPLIESFIKSIFATKIVLFIGYSFSDINLKHILQKVKNILGENYQNAYLISTRDNPHPAQVKYLDKKGIKLISYEDANIKVGKTIHNYIDKFLNGENFLKKNYKLKKSSLSIEGQKLYNILNFISNYNVLCEEIKDENIINKLYSVLIRFEDFGSIPSTFISKLYPFRMDHKKNNNVEDFELTLYNDEIINLFKNDVEKIDNRFKLRKGYLKLNNDEILELENKLKKIIGWLNNSLVLFINEESNKENEFARFKIDLRISNNTICNCLLCKLSRLEFKSLLIDFENSTIDEYPELYDKLQFVYVKYKLGEYINCYYLYESIAELSWSQSNYITYFLCKLNIKRLKNLIRFQNISENKDAEKIIAEIEKLDLDALLNSINEIDSNQKELLNIIKNDTYIIQLYNEIEKEIDSINHAFNFYNDGFGYIMGPNHAYNLERLMIKLTTYIEKNHIIFDESQTFKLIIKKSIHALLLSYSTNNHYNSKIEEVDLYITRIVLHHSNNIDLKKSLKDLKIKQLKIKPNTKKSIFNEINSFLQSTFNEGIFGSLKVQALQKKSIDHYFSEKLRSIFNNALTWLSYIEIEESAFKELFSNLINFLNKETFLIWVDFENLRTFLISNLKHLKENEVDKIIDMTVSKQIPIEKGRLIELLDIVIIKNNLSYKITDEYYINDLINYLTKNNSARNTKYLPSLYNIVDKKYQKNLKEIIVNKLNTYTKFDVDLYINSVNKKIIAYEQFFTDYIKHIDKEKQDSKYEERNSKCYLVSYIFYNFILFIDSIDLDRNDSRLLELKNCDDFMYFLINPDSFNYSKFDVKWLLIDNIPQLVSKFIIARSKINKILIDKINESYEEKYSIIFMNYFH